MRPGDIDLSDPGAFAQGFPHDYFDMLRAQDPVSWNESRFVSPDHDVEQRGFYSVTRHADVVAVSRNPEVFSSAKGGVQILDRDEEGLQHVRAMLLSMDPPEHVDYRHLVNRGFTPRQVQALRPRIRSAAAAIIDNVVDRGEGEFVTEVAMHLPMLLICELMGVPTADQQKIFDWSNQLVGFDDPGYSDPEASPMDVAMRVWMYAHELAEEKRRHPDDTLISQYANGEVDGQVTTEMQLNNFFVLLAIAGNETTRNATSHAIRLLHENPDQKALLLSDIDRYLPGTIDEVLRCSPPVISFRRTLTQPATLNGVELAEGDKVVMWYPSANRDEDVWTDVHRFDITRDSTKHLTFGIGEHFCLGAGLAKMQLNCILGEIMKRMPNIAVVGEPALLRSNLVAGIKTMNVTW
ncbi:cytochrome P450 [Mycobacterium spongiae]|uniref:Cytochrome P450 n=1 Tax=Mycobacterium spongiae TaxID=886343 RepID=A0A975JZ34_9MYCO|nr:cytochrome P450 [Mycobacterium spongiae]QUR68355.1 cytochrome P450 [Mycobacterium spongiae]